MFEPIIRWLSEGIGWLYDLTGEFGAAILISIILISAVFAPATIFRQRNRCAKISAAPAIQEIKKRYRATVLGVGEDEDTYLSPELRALGKDGRSEAMAKEIRAVYAQTGYKPYIGAILTVTWLLLIMMLYSGIAYQCPDGFYSLHLSEISQNPSENLTALVAIFSPLILTTAAMLFKMGKDLYSARKNKTAVYGPLLGGLAGLVLSGGLVYWFVSATTVAIALASACLSASTTGIEAITRKCRKVSAFRQGSVE